MFKSEFGIRENVRIKLCTTETKVGLRDICCDDVKLIKLDMSHIYLGIRKLHYFTSCFEKFCLIL
jgi:hypothetical protein